ncbi:copia protein [Tanacetum coccineum]
MGNVSSIPTSQPIKSNIFPGVDLEPDEWIKDSGCSKHMMGDRKLFSNYKAYNEGNVIFGSNLHGNIIGKGQICDNKCRVTFSEHDSEITEDGKVIELREFVAMVVVHGGESGGDMVNEKLKDEAIRLNKFEKSTHCLNEMLSNEKPSGEKLGLGFSSFEASSIGTKEINFVKALKKASSDGVDLEPDECITDSGFYKHMTGNQKLFSSYKEYNKGNVIFGSNLHSNIIVKGQIFDNKCRVIFSEQDSEITNDGKVIEPKNMNEALTDDSWIVAMQEELNQFIANDLFQMDVQSAFLNDFTSEEVYVAQPPGFIDFETPDHVYKPKKALYDLKQSPKAWYDRLKAFLIKHEYKMGMCLPLCSLPRGSQNLLGLWYPKGTDIETIVYANSDHAKQTALAISTTEAEYVSAGKTCQQALWMKQALIDYDV